MDDQAFLLLQKTLTDIRVAQGRIEAKLESHQDKTEAKIEVIRSELEFLKTFRTKVVTLIAALSLSGGAVGGLISNDPVVAIIKEKRLNLKNQKQEEK